MIGVGLAFAVILASLALVRGTCRLGSDLSRGSDRSVAALWALECIAADLAKAGLGVRGSNTDEAIELSSPGVLAFRADMDRDDPGVAEEPEERIAGGSDRVTTGNDEVLAFLRRSPDHGYGEEKHFWADMDSNDTATMEDGTVVAKRDDALEAVAIGKAMPPDDDRSATLYRMSFLNDATRFGTARFYSAQPLLDRVTSFEVRALDAGGEEVGPCGGEDDLASRDCRAEVRRFVLELRLEDVTDVFRREVFIEENPR